jgi:hypothetical protein
VARVTAGTHVGVHKGGRPEWAPYTKQYTTIQHSSVHTYSTVVGWDETSLP